MPVSVMSCDRVKYYSSSSQYRSNFFVCIPEGSSIPSAPLDATSESFHFVGDAGAYCTNHGLTCQFVVKASATVSAGLYWVIGVDCI